MPVIGLDSHLEVQPPKQNQASVSTEGHDWTGSRQCPTHLLSGPLTSSLAAAQFNFLEAARLHFVKMQTRLRFASNFPGFSSLTTQETSSAPELKELDYKPEFTPFLCDPRKAILLHRVSVSTSDKCGDNNSYFARVIEEIIIIIL